MLYNLRCLGTAAGWYDMNPMAALPRTGNGNVVDGRYHYLKDLLELEAAATGQGPNTFRPATPLKLSEWKEALVGHPDQQFSRYILHGLAHGFHIGASRAMGLHPSHSNMPSVHQLPDLVEKQIRAEVDAGRLLGPLPPHLARMVQTSSIGLIPKPHQQGKWRLIVNLSSPAGASVNDAIASDSCHMQYTSVLEAARLIQQLGVGTQLAKIGLAKCIPHGACPPWRPSTPRHTLGPRGVYRHCSPLWFEVGTQNILSCVWCARLDPLVKGG